MSKPLVVLPDGHYVSLIVLIECHVEVESGQLMALQQNLIEGLRLDYCIHELYSNKTRELNKYQLVIEKLYLIKVSYGSNIVKLDPF